MASWDAVMADKPSGVMRQSTTQLLWPSSAAVHSPVVKSCHNVARLLSRTWTGCSVVVMHICQVGE